MSPIATYFRTRPGAPARRPWRWALRTENSNISHAMKHRLARSSPPRHPNAVNCSAATEEVETQRTLLKRARPASRSGKVLVRELDLAARMAVQSCKYMLWQQALAAGKDSTARWLAKKGIQELRELERDFRA